MTFFCIEKNDTRMIGNIIIINNMKYYELTPFSRGDDFVLLFKLRNVKPVEMHTKPISWEENRFTMLSKCTSPFNNQEIMIMFSRPL